jgi:hypothetical protein
MRYLILALLLAASIQAQSRGPAPIFQETPIAVMAKVEATQVKPDSTVISKEPEQQKAVRVEVQPMANSFRIFAAIAVISWGIGAVTLLSVLIVLYNY